MGFGIRQIWVEIPLMSCVPLAIFFICKNVENKIAYFTKMVLDKWNKLRNAIITVTDIEQVLNK